MYKIVGEHYLLKIDFDKELFDTGLVDRYYAKFVVREYPWKLFEGMNYIFTLLFFVIDIGDAKNFVRQFKEQKIPFKKFKEDLLELLDEESVYEGIVYFFDFIYNYGDVRQAYGVFMEDLIEKIGMEVGDEEKANMILRNSDLDKVYKILIDKSENYVVSYLKELIKKSRNIEDLLERLKFSCEDINDKFNEIMEYIFENKLYLKD